MDMIKKAQKLKMKGPPNGELSYNSLKDGGDRSVLTDDSYNETESYHTEN